MPKIHGLILMLAAAVGVPVGTPAQAAPAGQPQITSRAKPVLTQGGLSFRDLNANGLLDPYEDWRLAPEQRTADLVRRMTLEEKAGQMTHGAAPSAWASGGAEAPKGYLAEPARLIVGRGVGSLITRLSGSPAFLAKENNDLQAMAEATRLGAPLMISTDPRSHFGATIGLSVAAGGFSQWPETLGFAAIGDAELMRRFGVIVREEYRSAGIQQALSPQADLATEPRWPRISGTFGEDADLAGRMVRAYVAGFQGSPTGLARDGVATVVKHWVGYGAARDGWDSHNAYGQHADLTDETFAYHLKPWDGAFAAGAAGLMPTYSILNGPSLSGRTLKPVGAGFSSQLLKDLARGRYRFDGVILSDWAITNDCPEACRGQWAPGRPPSIGMPWGVEELSRVQRFAEAVAAGIDQFGGVDDPAPLVQAVREGLLDERQVDDSVRRILVQKFRLGLFEAPYVDPKAADARAGRGSQSEADSAQSRSLVVLENRGVLPIAAGKKVYLKGVSPDAAMARGLIPVADPSQADVAIIRAAAPFQVLHPNYFFGAMHHEGDLDFKEDGADFRDIKSISAKSPTVLTVYLDRPAVLTNVRDLVRGLVGDFGVGDGPLLDALMGKVKPEGRLPFELPSSMEAVRAQRPDLPHDSAKPLYPIHYRAQ